MAVQSQTGAKTPVKEESSPALPLHASFKKAYFSLDSVKHMRVCVCIVSYFAVDIFYDLVFIWVSLVK